MKVGTTNVVRLYVQGYVLNSNPGTGVPTVFIDPLGKACTLNAYVYYDGNYYKCLQTEAVELKDESNNLMHKRITATFNANGGSGGSSQTVTWNVENIVTPTEPTRTNYTFEGWFTASSGGTEVTFPVLAPSANITYYAQWAVSGPTAWSYIGASTNSGMFMYDGTTIYTGRLSSCPLSAEVSSWLTNMYPPANYGFGYVFRVTVKNKYGTICNYMWFSAA